MAGNLRSSVINVCFAYSIDVLWSLCLGSQHHPAIYWAMELLSSMTGQNKCYGNILLYMTSVIYIICGHFKCKQSCFIEKNVPIEFILPSRWLDGVQSLGIEITSCLCQCLGLLLFCERPTLFVLFCFTSNFLLAKLISSNLF